MDAADAPNSLNWAPARSSEKAPASFIRVSRLAWYNDRKRWTKRYTAAAVNATKAHWNGPAVSDGRDMAAAAAFHNPVRVSAPQPAVRTRYLNRSRPFPERTLSPRHFPTNAIKKRMQGINARPCRNGSRKR